MASWGLSDVKWLHRVSRARFPGEYLSYYK